ncbi:MAG: SPFH domain-containing protein, partial [Alphaproteobacteria bacterium]
MSRKLIAAGVGIVALGIVGLSSVFVVQEQEQAIVLQLGAFVRVEQRPGLHLKLPFVQDVRYFDKRVLDFEADLGEINTADQKQTLVDTYSRYRITDPLRFLQTAGTIEGFEARREDAPFNAIIKSTVREVFARAELATLLTAKRAEVMQEITSRVRTEVARFGVQVI